MHARRRHGAGWWMRQPTAFLERPTGMVRGVEYEVQCRQRTKPRLAPLLHAGSYTRLAVRTHGQSPRRGAAEAVVLNAERSPGG